MKDKHISKSLVAAFLSLCCCNIGLNTNAMDQNPQESFSVKPIKSNEDSKRVKANNIFLEGNSSYFIKSSNDSVAIKLNYPFNLLVVADNEERMQKITSLLCNNNLNLNLGNLKQLQDFHKYKSGGVYQAVNNPNVNIFCITLDDFNSDKFNRYSWNFICQNTSKIFYVFKSESYKDKKCFDVLQKFYHKFNRHWCGNDVAYNENYEPDLNTVATSNFKGPVLEKGRNDWFEYVRVKRGQSTNHRYIYFILDNNKIIYPFNLEHYVSKMPDARSISCCELNDNLNVKFLLEMIISGYYETPQRVVPFNNDNIKKMSFKKIGLITAGGVGAIGMVTAISALIKKKLSEKPRITKPEVNKQENNKLLT